MTVFQSFLLLFAINSWSLGLNCPAAPAHFHLSKPNPQSLHFATLTFPSRVHSLFKADNTVWAHYALPKGPKPFPAILVLPVMAAPNTWIEKQFIRKFVEAGFAVLFLETPYQFHRRPNPSVPSGEVFLARNPKILAQNFRQAVSDSCAALNWLRDRPEVNPREIGIFGISLGSLVGSATYSISSVPKYGVFLLGGANLPDLLFHSRMTAPFVKKIGVSEKELEKAWKGMDALDYAKKNADKPALLINANSDHIIPRKNALLLKQAFPNSRQIWVPFGHYTAMIHLFWIPRYVTRAFLRHLK